MWSTHFVSLWPRWSFHSQVALLAFRPIRPRGPTWPLRSTLANFSKRSWTTLRPRRRCDNVSSNCMQKCIDCI